MRTVTYRGHADAAPAGPRLVTVEHNGEVVGLLPHIVKHSPDGMSWGYGGSAPADLARSLLLAALGAAAKCSSCDGTARVVHDPLRGKQVPASAAEHVPGVKRCACGDGWAQVPYQEFKWEIVAKLPDQGWTLTNNQIVTWLGERQRAAGIVP